MRGSIIVRELSPKSAPDASGSGEKRAKPLKRYDAMWRVNGKQRAKTFTRQKDAETYLTETVKKITDNICRDLKPAPMGDVFDRWLAFSLDVRVKEGSLKPSIAKSYRSILEEYLRPAFAEYRSDQLSVEAIETWRAGVAAKIAEGRLAARVTSTSGTCSTRSLDWDRHRSPAYLAHNPTKDLERLRLPKAKKRPHFDSEQVAELFRVAEASPLDDTIIRLARFISVLHRVLRCCLGTAPPRPLRMNAKA
jgi:hypothetical protein